MDISNWPWILCVAKEDNWSSCIHFLSARFTAWSMQCSGSNPDMIGKYIAELHNREYDFNSNGYGLIMSVSVLV